jgi:hypothetical protein
MESGVWYAGGMIINENFEENTYKMVLYWCGVRHSSDSEQPHRMRIKSGLA